MSNVTEEFHLSFSYAVFLTMLNGLSSLVGTVGNILVLLVILKSRTLNSATDYLIVSLASADLLVTSTMQPMFAYHINFYVETDETIFDLTLDITGYVSNLASLSSMLLITFDRLVAIRFPFKYKTILSTRKVIVVVIVVWVCSATFGVFFRLFSLSAGWLWGISSLLLLGTLSAYPYIFFVARKQERISRQLTKRVDSVSPSESSSGKTTRFRVFAEMKSTKTVAIVVGIFALCWIPILVYTQIKTNQNSSQKDFLPGFFVVYTLSMWNSALNPFVYCARNQRYRVVFQKLLRRSRSVGPKPSSNINHAIRLERE